MNILMSEITFTVLNSCIYQEYIKRSILIMNEQYWLYLKVKLHIWVYLYKRFWLVDQSFLNIYHLNIRFILHTGATSFTRRIQKWL